MPKITYKDIMDMGSCYDPAEIGMPKDYEADILDCIKEYRYKVKQPQDIFWVVLRTEYLSAKALRLFAVACAKEAMQLVEDPDPRSLKVIEVAEKFAYGKATKEELKIASTSAVDAYAASTSTYAAAFTSAAYYAASSTSTAYYAADAAYAAASARKKQIDILIGLIEKEGEGYL